MANPKTCIKCGRSIDDFARACPYCTWWQSDPLPMQPTAPRVVDYTPPPDNRARNTLLGIITFGFLMMVAFTVGALFHGSDEAKAAQSKEEAAVAAAQPSPRATVTLVPMTDGTPPPAIESPITSVMLNGATTTAGPSDATALPSEQYAAAATRTRAAQQQATGRVVDPRSITGSPYAAPPPRAARPLTQPVATYQPVPHVRVDREQTAQLSLTVGTDGRVHDIEVQRAAPGLIGPLVGAVQQWRFRPATQNGEPVTSRFSVAVTFKP